MQNQAIAIVVGNKSTYFQIIQITVAEHLPLRKVVQKDRYKLRFKTLYTLHIQGDRQISLRKIKKVDGSKAKQRDVIQSRHALWHVA